MKNVCVFKVDGLRNLDRGDSNIIAEGKVNSRLDRM